MSFEVPRVGQPDIAEISAVQPRPHIERAVQQPAPQPVAEAVTVDMLPSRPPVDVLEEIAAAHERWDELRSQQRELHFTHDDVANRVVVEVRDLDGNVLRTVPPSKALDIIAGAPFK